MSILFFKSRGWMPYFFALMFSAVSVAADELTDEAQTLVDQGRHDDAFNLLIADIEESAGTPEYDLLLGIAALESGRPTQAVFAFERVLAVEPGNTRARLELARAYYEMGENEAAREEFSYAGTQQVPQSVRQTIEEYLTSIDSRLSRGDSRSYFDMYLQARGGYDSNVNSATDSSTVALPAFGNLEFTLDESARELDSWYSNFQGGLSFSQAVGTQSPLSVFGAASLFYRPTYNESDFDTGAGNAQLGLRYTRDRNSFLVSLQGQKYYIDGDVNRNQAGVNLQWLHTAGERTQYSVFVQGLGQRFPEQTVRNVNQFMGGLGIVHLLQGKGNPVVYASAFVGTDHELLDTRPDFGRNFYGLRAGGEYSIREDLKLVGGLSYQHSRYGGDDPLFQETRNDHFVFLRSAVEYSYAENWVITPELRYMLNDSSLPINEFDRWQVMATVRYNF
ncbi:MAG: tetratricopeptide repeat protein [Gammaproteobacteria bacterium]